MLELETVAEVPAGADGRNGHRREVELSRLLEAVLRRLVELLGAVLFAVLVPFWRVSRDDIAFVLRSAEARARRQFERARFNLNARDIVLQNAPQASTVGTVTSNRFRTHLLQ